MLKRLFALILMLALMLSAGINVRAYGLENDSGVVNDKLNESVFEESEALKLSQNNLSRAITDYGMIPYSTNFERYDNGCFAQWQNVCVQLAVANTLSYFDYLGRSNLIVGSSLSQAEFTEIGYKIENGVKYLLVHNGDQTELMKWLKLSKVIRVYKVWIS